MTANTFTQWAADGNAFGHGPEPLFRSPKDRLLSGYKTSVETPYPDGYLGPMEGNRRADKLLGTINRMNARQYNRGVHKGERIAPTDYLWPDEFGKFTGLMYQQAGVRFAPVGQEPVRLVNDGKVPISRGINRGAPTPAPAMADPDRQAKLKALAPRWI